MSCPICKEKAVEKYRPFCSSRCAEIDLGRWLKGDYAVPAVSTDDPDADAQVPDEEIGKRH